MAHHRFTGGPPLYTAVHKHGAAVDLAKTAGNNKISNLRHASKQKIALQQTLTTRLFRGGDQGTRKQITRPASMPACQQTGN